MIRPEIIVTGMFGIGDNLHQRAVIRELIRHYDVWLESCHYNLYHDFVEQGLKIILRPTGLRAQAKTLNRELAHFTGERPINGVAHALLTYNKSNIDRHGSILGSMLACAGVRPARPDFSLPIKPEWQAKARELIDAWKPDRPIMIYRPVILRREWNGANRNPDPEAYVELLHSFRHEFFMVSIADLAPKLEWFLEPEQDADIKLHHGELDFPTMAALFADAALVYSPAGFAPVLAQAVGTPGITVYGGRESFRTTQAAGAHLAPSLGIDPDHPCDCHSYGCPRCNKHITLPPAKERIKEFIDRWVP